VDLVEQEEERVEEEEGQLAEEVLELVDEQRSLLEGFCQGSRHTNVIFWACSRQEDRDST